MEMIEATGKAKCQICHKKIEEGTQVKAPLGSMYDRSYHLDCFKNENWEFLYDMFQTYTTAEMEDLYRETEE